MLPLETKQSGGKLLPHSDLRGGVFLEEVSRSHKQWEDNIKMDPQKVGGVVGTG
jgi:hypothetical protein